MDLVLDVAEQPVGDFSLDLLGHDLSDDSVVIVENQLGQSDRVHLGQILTYAAGRNPTTISDTQGRTITVSGHRREVIGQPCGNAVVQVPVPHLQTVARLGVLETDVRIALPIQGKLLTMFPQNAAGFESCRGHSLFFEVAPYFERFIRTAQQSSSDLPSHETAGNAG
jgi:hypothetical protein